MTVVAASKHPFKWGDPVQFSAMKQRSWIARLMLVGASVGCVSWVGAARIGPLAAPARPRAAPASPTASDPGRSIERLDPALDGLVTPGSAAEKLAGGFGFLEGPVYLPSGGLLFSDIPRNVIRRWSPTGTSVFRTEAGDSRTDVPPEQRVGSNGLTLDRGRLIICEQGNRRVTRLESDGRLTVLAARFHGRRFNSPNDVIVKSDGGVYFTDPPYGLPKGDADPAKELTVNGVYRIWHGHVQLLIANLQRPNGLAFSPHEDFLYVDNSDPGQQKWMRYPVKRDGTLGAGSVFLDPGPAPDYAAGVPDGMKLDRHGNIFSSGPHGVWIISPQGRHLGTIHLPETPANLAWGAEGGALATGQAAHWLYITAQTGLYRIYLQTSGRSPR